MCLCVCGLQSFSLPSPHQSPVPACFQQSRRPSVNDLLEFPQISIRIREQKVKDRLELVRDREEKLRREKESLKSLQEEVNRTRELLEMREAQIRKREEELGLTSASAPCGELVGIPRTVSEKVLRTEYEVGGTVAATRRDALADKENMGLQFQAEYPRKVSTSCVQVCVCARAHVFCGSMEQHGGFSFWSIGYWCSPASCPPTPHPDGG